jgi:hypothetical protein
MQQARIELGIVEHHDFGRSAALSVPFMHAVIAASVPSTPEVCQAEDSSDLLNSGWAEVADLEPSHSVQCKAYEGDEGESLPQATKQPDWCSWLE